MATPGGSELTISPLIIDVTLEPGQSTTTQINITAGSGGSLTVAFEHADFGFANSSYEMRFIEDSAPTTTPFSTRGWFGVPHVTYRIARSQTITVPLRITAPRNATPGTHLGAAFFRTVADVPRGSASRVITSARSGPLVFVSIKGGSAPKPKIRRFDTPGVVSAGPVPVKLTIGNDGDTHFTFQGTLSLDGRSGHSSIDIPQRYSLPDLDREIRNDKGDTVRLGDRKLRAGRHTVTLALETQPGNGTLTAERVVWVIPAWLRVLLALAILAVLGGVVWVIYKLRERRLLRLADAYFGEIELDDDAEPESSAATGPAGTDAADTGSTDPT